MTEERIGAGASAASLSELISITSGNREEASGVSGMMCELATCAATLGAADSGSSDTTLEPDTRAAILAAADLDLASFFAFLSRRILFSISSVGKAEYVEGP